VKRGPSTRALANEYVPGLGLGTVAQVSSSCSARSDSKRNRIDNARRPTYVRGCRCDGQTCWWAKLAPLDLPCAKSFLQVAELGVK
jgi:hypothetical protein